MIRHIVRQRLPWRIPARLSRQLPFLKFRNKARRSVVDTPAPTVTYRIGEKESLYRIAVNHNTTVSTLLALNPRLDERHYEAGQTILVGRIVVAGR